MEKTIAEMESQIESLQAECAELMKEVFQLRNQIRDMEYENPE